MLNFVGATVSVLTILISPVICFAQPTESESYIEMHGAPPRIHFRRDAAPIKLTGISPQLIYHNGNVLRSNFTAAIFWGSPWSNASFASDKISGLDTFFNGFGGSSYAKTGNEYYDLSGPITSTSVYLGHVIDTSAVPNRALKVSAAVGEVCKITNNNPALDTTYFIYTSSKAGNVNYCAWHSWGKCSNGAPVQVAYMPNLDGIAGCDPQDSASGHSQGLAALANVTAHELLEAITDPRGAGWYDSSGEENADKCAWSFPTAGGLSTFYNGSKWKLQMEWSNAAYTAGTGLPNRSGQKACIY
jgi:hypothetical protein